MTQHGFARRLLYKAEVACLLVIARGMVALLPFSVLRRFLGDLSETGEVADAPEPSADQREWSILIGRYIKETEARLPFEVVCLPQAIVGRWILRTRGVDSKVVVGAKKAKAGVSVEFHAWLLVGSTCIIGDAGSKGFEPFQTRTPVERDV